MIIELGLVLIFVDASEHKFGSYGNNSTPVSHKVVPS